MASTFPSKRLVLCCDGTWMDADDGFEKPTLIPYVPTGTLQVPSNVTRISRALKRVGRDGKPQIIYYHSGVGTGSSALDALTGGFLGTGISETIREVYAFIAANYLPGDEIILIGFSRGAFTVRSVASIIRDIGLLNRRGMEYFYPIFKDQQNFRNPRYHDIFPTIPFSKKPGTASAYKRKLEDNDLTRVVDPDGSLIRVQAVAVWDTVGSLGIPTVPLLQKFGLSGSTREYRFFDTSLSDIVRHAFQALALDERRAPFSPAVWERPHMDHTTLDLRQVWFPGAHSNVGGGYPDQEMANITLAWMMDQLASIGLAFQDNTISELYARNVDYFRNPPKQRPSVLSLFSRRPLSQWAITPVYEKHKPVRPFALGEIVESKTGVWDVAGKITRSPGLYCRVDPDTGAPTGVPMEHTNERIHSSVRIRLELEGLGPSDISSYKCPALFKNGPWRLREVKMRKPVKDPIPWDAQWGNAPPATRPKDDFRWVWEYDGPDDEAPHMRTMIEENLGPYQRELLLMSSANTNSKRRKKTRHKRTQNTNIIIDNEKPHPQRTQRYEEETITLIQERPPDRRSDRYRRSETVIVEPESVLSSHDRRRRERRENSLEIPLAASRLGGSGSLLSSDRRERYERRQEDDEIIVEVEEDRIAPPGMRGGSNIGLGFSGRERSRMRSPLNGSRREILKERDRDSGLGSDHGRKGGR